MGVIKRIQCPIKNCGEIFDDVLVGQPSPYYIHYLIMHARIPKPIQLPEMNKA